MNDDQALHDFVAKNARPYDPATDDYDRPPFAADIKEGKTIPSTTPFVSHESAAARHYPLHPALHGAGRSDPRSILRLGHDGRGGADVRQPPPDLLQQFPELRDRVGPRACILNDLRPPPAISPTTITPRRCRRAAARVRADQGCGKGRVRLAYGTEHYEPAVGV